MPDLAVYDSMVMLQWAARSPQSNRQHATIGALMNGKIRLAMSRELLDEIRGVFFRPELQSRFPSLTPTHAAAIIKKALEFADQFENVPAAFSLPGHSKDDHLFNLAIHAKAKYLVTWETRILQLESASTPAATTLRKLSPDLEIVTPKRLADILR